MADVERGYELKLPSDPRLVTVDNIWRFLETIGKTGSTFTKQNLVDCGLYTSSQSTIMRVLSYLKYLGVVEETRVKVDRGAEKKENLQKFQLVPDRDIEHMVYEFRAGRKDKAKAHLSRVVAKHDLYAFIRDSFFGDTNVRTFIDLEHSLREHFPGQRPEQIQNGGRFLIDLLTFLGLTQVDENEITLMGQTRTATTSAGPTSHRGADALPDDVEALEDTAPLPLPPTGPAQNVESYTVSIAGPNISGRYRVSNEKELKVVKAIIDLIAEFVKE